MENPINIPDYIPVLSHGGHSDPKKGACVMEMVSFIAGEKWTDHPDCVHSAIQEIARNTNDFVSDDNRNIISDMIPRFIGTDEIHHMIGGNDKFQKLIRTKLAAHPELAQFISAGKESPRQVLTAIGNHFNGEADLDKRFTNEEYDKFAMTNLEVVLDAADEILVRGNYAVTKEEAFAKVAELPNQRNAVKASAK